MTLSVSKNSTFLPRAHRVTYRDPNALAFCVDRFPARNMDQAESFARRRAPKGAANFTILGPEETRFFVIGREA